MELPQSKLLLLFFLINVTIYLSCKIYPNDDQTVVITDDLKAELALGRTQRPVEVTEVIVRDEKPKVPESLAVIYNRIPKTGSTAFTHVVYKLVEPNNMYVVHIDSKSHSRNAAILNMQDQQDFIKNVTSWEDPVIFHGHIAFLKFKERKPFYINMIRNPLDRLISYYYFVRTGDTLRGQTERQLERPDKDVSFSDCVIEKVSPDCGIYRMWLQIPFFCGQASPCWEEGSDWALQQAKYNLLNEYYVVGLNEQMEKFIQLLDYQLPHIFKGAYEIYKNQEPIRVTNHKDPISDEARQILSNTKVWRMEFEFYDFAKKIFNEKYSRSFNDKGKILPQQYYFEKISGPN